MMKTLYITMITICILFLLVIYFTNIIYLWTQPMYLWSQNTRVSIEIWLFLIIIAGFILWFATFWLITTLINRKPKDFDEFDL